MACDRAGVSAGERGRRHGSLHHHRHRARRAGQGAGHRHAVLSNLHRVSSPFLSYSHSSFFLIKLPQLVSWLVGVFNLSQRLEIISGLFFDINQPSLPTLYSVLMSVSVFMALSPVFHSINSPDNSPLSHSVRLVLFLPFSSISLYKSLPQP